MKRLVFAVLASAGFVLGLANAAAAKTVNLGPTEGIQPIEGDIIARPGHAVVSFVDDWAFEVSQNDSDVNATVFNFNYPSSLHAQIAGLQLELFSGTPTGSHTLLESTSLRVGAPDEALVLPTYSDAMANVHYFFQVVGKVPVTVPQGEYDLDIDVNAIPEPATWAMMLIAFAGVGFVARRRGTRHVTA